ncbi:MAG TPA: DUF952 domain-containing protein [Pseudolysinimonas sp.]|nr:DUF952 domain-containing protein [Pseudolysinimonas sp.]
MTTRVEWDAAHAVGSSRMSTKGATLDEVGFIHASSAEQLPRVAAFLYGDSSEPLVVLELDDEAIRASGIRILWEDGGAGELFPHIYGALDTALVVAVHPAGFDSAGVLRY